MQIKKQAGFALMTLVFVMMVFAVLTSAIVALVVVKSHTALGDYNYEKAFYIAEAGKNYGLKYLAGQSDWTAAMGFPITKTFGGGVFKINTTDATANKIKLISTGLITVGATTYQRQVRVTVQKTPWAFTNEYVLYWGGNGGGAGTTQFGNNIAIIGDLLTNSDLNLGSGITVSGDAYSVGNISGDTSGITGNVESNTDLPDDPPELDTTYYDGELAIAATYPAGNQTWASQTISGSYYVHGDLNILNNKTINISGTARVVVTGTVIMDNNVTIGDNLTLIAGGLISMSNNVEIGSSCVFFSSVGFIINNNLETGAFAAGEGTSFLTPGYFSVNNNAEINGLIFAEGTVTLGQNVDFSGNIIAGFVDSVGNNSTLTLAPDLIDYSSLIGLTGGTISSVTRWEEVY